MTPDEVRKLRKQRQAALDECATWTRNYINKLEQQNNQLRDALHDLKLELDQIRERSPHPDHFKVELAGWNGPDHIFNATRSSWHLRSSSVRIDGNVEPSVEKVLALLNTEPTGDET